MADASTQAQRDAFDELHAAAVESGTSGMSSYRPPLPIDVPAGYATASVRGFRVLIAPDGTVEPIPANEVTP